MTWYQWLVDWQNHSILHKIVNFFFFEKLVLYVTDYGKYILHLSQS